MSRPQLDMPTMVRWPELEPFSGRCGVVVAASRLPKGAGWKPAPQRGCRSNLKTAVRDRSLARRRTAAMHRLANPRSRFADKLLERQARFAVVHLPWRMLHRPGRDGFDRPGHSGVAPSLQLRIASTTTPALLGESSTLRRISRCIGTPPNPVPSMRRKQTLLSF